MQLTEPEVKEYYRLHNGLLLYVNGRKGLYPKIGDEAAIVKAGAKPQLALSYAAYDEPGLIEGYIQENPDGLSHEYLEVIEGWTRSVRGRFVVYRYTEENSIFIHAEGSTPLKAYGVMSLNTPLPLIIGTDLPIIVETVLLPFRSRVIYHGLIAPYPLMLGGGLREAVEKWYEEAILEFGLITEIDIG